MEPHPASVGLGRPKPMASQHLDYVLNAVAEPPRTRRAESGQRLADSNGLRQQPECVRRVVGDTPPSLAQFHRRPLDVVEKPDLPSHLLFPDELLPAGDDLGVGARLVQQGRGLQCGLPAADDRHSPAAELIQSVMRGAVRHKVGGQPGQFARNMCVRQEARCDDHLSREHRGFLGELHLEPAAALNHVGHRYISDVGNQLAGEPVGVPEEAIKRQRPDSVNIVIESMQPGIRSDVISPRRRRDYRSIRFRLKEQPQRHMSAPSIHRAADNRVFDAAMTKMRGNRQAKGACTNDEYVTHSHEAVPSYKVCGRLS